MIQLQFVLGAGWGSRLISWWGQGYGGYSHVDAILPTGDLIGARSDSIRLKNGTVIPPGVRVRPPDYEKWLKRTIVTLDATPVETERWQQFLLSKVGQGYDKSDILGLILGLPITSTGHWVCSWIQTSGLEVIGKFGYLPFYPQQVTPNELLFGVCTIGGKPVTTMYQ